MSVKLKKRLFWSMGIFLTLLVFLFGFSIVLEKLFIGRIHYNVYINDLNISGLNPEEAEELLASKIDEFERSDFKIILNNRELSWRDLNLSFDPDLAYQLILFDADKSIANAYSIARGKDMDDYYKRIKLLFFKEAVGLDFFVNEKELLKIVQENFSDLENPAQNVGLVFRGDLLLESSVNTMFYLEPERFGKKIDYVQFLTEFKRNIGLLKNDNIALRVVDDSPAIKLVDAKGLDYEADNFLDLAPITLFGKDDKKEFKIEALDFSSWLYLEPQFLDGKFFEVQVALDPEKVKLFLEKEIKPEVNRDSILPKFDFNNGRVVSFESGEDGLILNYEQSFLNIKEAFNRRDMRRISLVLDVDPIGNIGDINDLGIKEIIGTGHSSFAGSPVNRRHNIKIGANKLHGLIIKPGEEFSLVKALGEVDSSTGYLPELVIKGNKTIPEYGGGLCQVATTLFRGALSTGLAITERRNHSYRVSYYEPAGTDATIYSPHPDLKFKNDTGSNILIQARFEGADDIYFDFWGSSDGRIATTTYPVIYNIIKPEPTQIIETIELAPGEKKCTEKAHSGADAYFDYTIIYNAGMEDESRVEKRFYSKYIPWREVCLVGVAPKIENNTSSDDVVSGDDEGDKDLGTSIGSTAPSE